MTPEEFGAPNERELRLIREVEVRGREQERARHADLVRTAIVLRDAVRAESAPIPKSLGDLKKEYMAKASYITFKAVEALDEALRALENSDA